MTSNGATHSHHFGCPESADHADPQARHADTSPLGAQLAFKRDEDERRHKVEPHVARHAKPVHSEADHDDVLDTVFGETYVGQRRAEVTS